MGIIFVIDSSNVESIIESKNVFKMLMSHDFLIGKPFLIVANKQDLVGSFDCIEICSFLDIESLANQYRLVNICRDF
jgi:ADP-ribosylation factor-like protein 13B